MSNPIAVDKLNLAPLGAGDLIDRAVRLYRRHFMTLIRIAAPPVIVSAAGNILMTVGWREVAATGSDYALPLYVTLIVVGVVVWIVGILLTVIVMGGASRNLVTHLLWNEPVSARTTYRNVRARFWGLLGASLLVGFGVMIATVVAFIAWYLVLIIVMIGAVAFAAVAPVWFSLIVGVVGTTAATLGAMFVFFYAVGRLAYVPQAMMVEGKGVFDALSRSFALASGNVRRLMAMALFTTFAAYSALMILIIPLGWYGYLNGVDPSPWKLAEAPAWFSIGYNVLGELSRILLSPIWMLGLSLLYVDERVRHEGYDVELLAARQLGEMPQLGNNQAAPYAPALVTGRAAPPPPTPLRPLEPRASNSMLGLN